MSTATLYPEPIPHNSHDHGPRHGLGNSNHREEHRAWYRRWPWLPGGVARRSTTPTLRPQSPRLSGQSLESIIHTPSSMPAQLSNSQSAAESDRGDGKPTTPQYRSNLIIEKEKRLSGCLTSPASPHDEASGFPQAIPKDEVGPAETRYSSPIPSIHSDQLISSGSRQATTKPDKDFRQGLRSRPNSLSSGTSDSNSESYKYATNKSKLALDHLHSEHLVTFDGLTDAKYPHAFTSNPTGRSPEHDATSSSADPGLSDRDTTTPFRSVMPELATFFSPKSGVVSESSHMPTTPPSSSNSFVPDHPEPTSLRQPQVVSVVQEGSILNPMINTLADEAMEGYELGRLNNFTTFANVSSFIAPLTRSNFVEKLFDRHRQLLPLLVLLKNLRFDSSPSLTSRARFSYASWL